MAGPSPAMTSKKQRENDLISRRVGWCGFALLREERALALDAPAIAGEIAVAPHDTMAWHDDGELVAGAGLRNGTHGSGLPQRGGDVAVGRGAAGWDFLQGTPYPRLKRRAADIERQVERIAGPGDIAHDPLGPAGQRGIGRQQFRAREAAAQFGFEAGAVVAERGHADAALGRRDHRPAKPSRDDCKADRLALAAAPARRRGHAEPVRGRLVGPRAGAKPGGIGGLGNPLAGIEPIGETAEPVRLAPFARRRSGDLLEDAVEMEAADPGGTGQFREARQFVAGPDQGAGAADRGDMPVGLRALIRAAALAGPKAGGLGRGGGLVERDILVAGLARGAARPAIIPGRSDRIEKSAVLRRIMGEHGRPALFCVQHRLYSVSRHGDRMAIPREPLYPAIAFIFEVSVPRAVSSGNSALAASRECPCCRRQAGSPACPPRGWKTC